MIVIIGVIFLDQRMGVEFSVFEDYDLDELFVLLKFIWIL